jgi:hypothetical protein
MKNQIENSWLTFCEVKDMKFSLQETARKQ